MVDESASSQPLGAESSETPGYEIAQPSIEDVPSLLELWREQYDYHHQLDPVYYVPFTDELRARLETDLTSAIQSGDPHLLVARTDQAIVGFITYGIEEDSYYDANIKRFGVLKEVLVTAEARRGGVARSLITTVEGQFQEQGIKDVSIQCSSMNKTALDAYQALGYSTRQELLYKKLG